MNQSPTHPGTRPGTRPDTHLQPGTKLPPLPAQFRSPVTSDARLSRKFAEGLQLTRASTIALTRLQLALAGGDRRQAMAAIDRLHAIDGEIEHLVGELPPEGSPPTPTEPANDDPVAALGKHLADQKLALAFEKLALASGISGPDLVSPAHPLTHEPAPAPAETATALAEGEPPLVDWHRFPDVRTEVWDRLPAKLWGLVLALLVTAAIAAAAVVMTR